MGNKFSRRHRNRDDHQQAPPSGVPTSVSASQTHEDDSSTQSHTRPSKITVSENKESIMILDHQDKLISAVSSDTWNIAGVLREHEFISDEVSIKLLCPSSTLQEKATMLVSAVREKLKNAPIKFSELIIVLSEQVSTKDIAEMLQSAYEDRSLPSMDSHPSQWRHATDMPLPYVHSPGDDTASKPVTCKPHNTTQMISGHTKVSLTASTTQPLSLTDTSGKQHKDESVQTTSEGILAVSSGDSGLIEEPHQIMLRNNDKLITALSADPQGLAEILLAKGLIPEYTEAQMRQHTTSREKATILVTTIRQKIEIAPKRYHEFLDILSKQAWTKDIMEILQPCIGHEHLIKDVSIQAVRNVDGGHGSTNNGQKSSSDIPSNGEDHMFSKLNSEDKAELEAQLILSADRMRKKFASLLVSIVNSLKHQGIDPRDLATAILALIEYDDPAIGKPLLERDKEALMKAQTVDHTFDVLRPHMTFFNYEILEFLIEEMGSSNDKHNLQKFLQEFRRFCRRSVFEIPANVLGHSAEKAIDQQKFCVKITRQFKAALLVQCKESDIQTTSSTLLSTSHEEREGMICSPELGISLEDAKHIQRKLASVLKLKVSSLYLDSALSGSTILTFLLPSHISLVDLDSNPDVVALKSNGIHILCGSPSKPEPKELSSSGLAVQWSPPEYGQDSLVQYILHYQKQHEHDKSSQWQKIELNSLETRTFVPDLSDGDTYVFKICAVSDVGTLQFSNDSDPIVLSADGILTNNIHEVIVANKDILTSTISAADPNKVAHNMLVKSIISEEDEDQICLVPTPSEKTEILVTAIEHRIKSAPSTFQDFLNALSETKLSLPADVVETLWSEYYDSVYKQYLEYLKFLYASLDKKQTTSNQWPPSATKKFFRLAMIKTATVRRGYIDDRFVQMTITGKVDDILQEKYPIQLEDIFKETEGQRKVILLEGAPGCGKSTLSVYICQQWEKGHLFNQFKLIILVQLRDPAIRKAKGLDDLLPCPDTKTAQEIAVRMLANKCQDVLFVLDGWDELPPNLRENSIFHQLVQLVSYTRPLPPQLWMYCITSAGKGGSGHCCTVSMTQRNACGWEMCTTACSVVTSVCI